MLSVTVLDDLTDAQKFALTALLEVQPAATVGDFAGETDEGDYVTTYRFATTLTGYPGWVWTIAIADLPDEHPTVVESELLPADGALLAPDWIPWSERMEEYRAAQAALGETEAELVIGADDDDDESDVDDDELDDDDDDDDDDDADDDDDEDDVLGSDNLHSGDLDGVDIDELDPAESDDSAADLLEFDSEQDEAEFDDGDLTAEAEVVIASEALDLQVDEGDEPEPESSSGSENPPRVSRRRKRASEEQHDDEGD